MKTRRGIFQGDSLSPLLFVMMMIPLTSVPRQTKISYELKKRGKKINDLLFMNDLKLFAKNEDQIDNLVNTVRIFFRGHQNGIWVTKMWGVNHEKRKSS